MMKKKFFLPLLYSIEYETIQVVNRDVLEKQITFFCNVSYKQTFFYTFVTMDDDENDDDDDGWKILQPDVLLFETSIGLV